MRFEDFWYVVALSRDLTKHKVLSRTVLGEWLVVFRSDQGEAVVLRDRCMHRHSRLSRGKVTNGKLHCPYHGWVYDHLGQVIAVPSEGTRFKSSSARCAIRYDTKELDGFVYVRLGQVDEEIPPFKMPFYKEVGWETIRVINRFNNNVTNCVENFIDIPHTVSVHPGVFRNQYQQELGMKVRRIEGRVLVEYRQESNNFGWYSRFLNFSKDEVYHTDSFIMPNVTSVEYRFGENRRLFITSQSIPESDDWTLVYTDVTYNYGWWNKLVRPLVYWTTQYIINQDVQILSYQQEVIQKYGVNFANTPADTIHVLVESIRNQIAQGQDPRKLSDQSVEVKFWV